MIKKEVENAVGKSRISGISEFRVLAVATPGHVPPDWVLGRSSFASQTRVRAWMDFGRLPGLAFWSVFTDTSDLENICMQNML